MTARLHDVAAVGGGPAGSAAALALRRHAPELTVVLLEAGDHRGLKAGEVLPALAAPLLDRLGLGGAFAAEGFTPSLATASAWAGESLAERHSLFSAAGHGWHLDRARFDRLLADGAAAAGVQLRRGWPVTGAAATPLGWRLRSAGGAVVDARLLIWATGRSWRLARSLGARVTAHDRRAAFLRFFADAAADGRTLIEARPEGWWYTADLPGHQRVIACISDAAGARAARLRSARGWYGALAATRHVRAALGEGAVELGAAARPAGTVTLAPVCGPGWFAVGDTAFAADPLSSRGLVAALRSGIFAAYAAADACGGRGPQAEARYAWLLAHDVAQYRDALRRHYAEAADHADQPFWRVAAEGIGPIRRE